MTATLTKQQAKKNTTKRMTRLKTSDLEYFDLKGSNLEGSDLTVSENSLTATETSQWQNSLSNAITDVGQLYKRLQLDTSDLSEKAQQDAEQAAEKFKVFVTESYLQRMELKNWNDPLLKQVLPLGEENLSHPLFTQDPLGEENATQLPGLLHKYKGRALLITNSHCAINCRFCFRKNFPYSSNHYSSENKAAILNYLKQNTDIHEVILSGGDPLLLNDRSLQDLMNQLSDIPHIQRIRFHTRIPIVLPERITSSLLSLFTETRLQVVMVIHCNHAKEINSEVSERLKKLKVACFSLLNQSVLLKGVNDSVDTLEALQHALFAEQVQSYYLHRLDKVKGTQHFDIPRKQALSLYNDLQSRLPGYMVPKLVEERAGESNKTQLS